MYTIDTSVFINAVEPHEQDHAASRQLLGLLRARQIPVIVPTLVTVEVAGTVSRLRDAARAQRLTEILLRLRMVSFVSLDDPLARQAAALAAVHRLRGADAVYAAVSQQYATTLVSRDREHLTRLVGVIPVCTPSRRWVRSSNQASPSPPAFTQLDGLTAPSTLIIACSANAGAGSLAVRPACSLRPALSTPCQLRCAHNTSHGNRYPPHRAGHARRGRNLGASYPRRVRRPGLPAPYRCGDALP